MDPETADTPADQETADQETADPAAAWQRLDAALTVLEDALLAQRRQSAEELQAVRRELEQARAENARLAEALKAEQARVQRLEDLTSAVSGRVDSAIGELESILEP
ncbi:DUF4164 family protein [Marinibaculum pumilum]|uniref:DUF4164 family protein n=1 Tax=Marinibaculum pumilum TaxID=1766165 RepID=A0ABV7L6R8_9PROT